MARLSGSTVEFLHLWAHLFLGPQPFQWSHGELVFAPNPQLHARMFHPEARDVQFFGQNESLPAHSAACALLGRTLLVYINPQMRNTYGATNSVAPVHYRLVARDGAATELESPRLRGAIAERMRAGEFRRVEVTLK